MGIGPQPQARRLRLSFQRNQRSVVRVAPEHPRETSPDLLGVHIEAIDRHLCDRAAIPVERLLRQLDLPLADQLTEGLLRSATEGPGLLGCIDLGKPDADRMPVDAHVQRVPVGYTRHKGGAAVGGRHRRSFCARRILAGADLANAEKQREGQASDKRAPTIQSDAHQREHTGRRLRIVRTSVTPGPRWAGVMTVPWWAPRTAMRNMKRPCCCQSARPVRAGVFAAPSADRSEALPSETIRRG